VYNAAQPEKHNTADGLRHSDETRDPKCKHRRWVAEDAGRIVGVAEYDQFAGMYHPRKFGAWINLTPEHDTLQNRAVLWNRIMTALEPFEPLSVLSYGREDRRTAIEFLESQGFEEKMRYWESRLDVNAFDPSPYSSVQDDVRAAGFEIRTLAELEADPEYQQRFFEMWADCRRDVPRPDEATEVGFEQFSKWTFESPYLLPDACFIALETATLRWAGMSQIWKGEGEDKNLHTGLTAVRREYRRNKLALAMKLRGIEYAKAVESPEIRTGNESNNRGMLAINEMLGFVKEPAWIDLVKVLCEE
jgi:hypothetical protein